MFKKFRLKRKLFLISIPVLILISAAALYSNGIFYFSEFKPSVEVKYSFEDPTKLKELLDKSAQLNNVASVDRVNNIVEIEGVSLNDVNKNIQDISKDYSGVSYSVKEVSSLRKGSLTELIIGLYFLFLAGVAIHFYFVSAKGGRLRIILGSYLSLLVNLTVTFFINLGLLSLISRFYKITSLDLLLVLISSILVYLIYYFAGSDIYELTSFQDVGNTFKNFLNINIRPILFVILVLLSVTTIGLGTAFVIHALLLFIFIVIAIFQFYWISYIFENRLNLQYSISYRVNSIRNFRKRKPQQIVSSNSSKKKDHSKGQTGKKKKKKK